MWEFAMSGWTDADMGGIYWKEGDLASKNTCSNGPAAVLGLMLHSETGDAAYLEEAIRILEWTAKLKDPYTGVYNDSIWIDGTINKAK